jgi:hypothetical protein
VTLYFFNYRGRDSYYADGEGTDFASLSDAQADARQSARELLGVERGENDAWFAGGAYEITDGAGSIHAIVAFGDNTA